MPMTPHKSSATKDQLKIPIPILRSTSELFRPGLTPHHSHVGYLTSSSPLITAKAVDTPDSPISNPTNAPHADEPLPGLNGADTPPSEEPAATASTTTLPSISDAPTESPLLRTDTLTLLAEDRSRRRRSSISGSIRGISPGRKLKEAFTLPATNKTSDVSPDRESTKSTGSGSFGGRLGKKGGLASRRQTKGGSPAPVPPQIRTSPSDQVTQAKTDLPPLDTAKPPKTPPSAALNGPLTTVTPPTPTEPQAGSPRASPRRKAHEHENNGIVVSHSGNMISHRRSKSEHQPSKLSNLVSAPVTPIPEEAKTPGSSRVNSQQASTAGFFSSWVSAAQNAANQLTISINTGNRSRSGTQSSDPEKTKVLEPTIEEESVQSGSPEKKPLAIETLGMGDLNFSHLGLDVAGSSDERISDGLQVDPSEVKQNSTVLRDEASARLEDARAARAVSAAYEKPTRDSSIALTGDDTQSVLRHRDTLSSNVTAGSRTPPNGSIFEGELGHGVKRSNSSRSRLAHRRNRGSSGATGHSTIGAMIGASTSTLTNPAVGPRITGYAVAPKTRNRNFHQLFRSVPDDDYLIEDYSCALQRDILLAGRLYISEGHICFSSNILGWVTTLVISFDEVMSIEKESTAMVFPNAIAIQTLHARHTFRSLLSREATYDLMIGIWKVSHPGTFKSTLNGVLLESGTGDKTEKTRDAVPSLDESEEEIYDEDDEVDEDAESFPDSGSIAASDFSGPPKPISRKPSATKDTSAAIPAVPNPPVAGDVAQGEKVAAAVSEATGGDFPGPTVHSPTDCLDSATHFEKAVKDETVPAPLGKIYTMLFGPNSPLFVSKFLLEEQKVTDLQFEDRKGLSNDVKTRQYSYIKPLGGSIGPKSTKCITTENLDFFDLEKAISVTCTTQTPDVPSGNAFSVKTRYCLSWAPGNGTRIQMNCGIEWTAKSWLKGPIEKGAIDGQLSYGNELVKSLKSGVSSRPRGMTSASKISKGKKKRKGDAKASSSPKSSSVSSKQTHDWGLFEPLHIIFNIVGDIIALPQAANAIIVILLSLLLITWLRGPSQKQSSTSIIGSGGNGLTSSSARLAAYEQLWQKEESELWQWLEERVGINNIDIRSSSLFGSSASDPSSSSSTSASAKTKHQNHRRSKLLSSKDMAARLREEKMSDREIEDAIRVTQERLDVLKSVVERKTPEGKSDKDVDGGGGGGVKYKVKGKLPVEDNRVEL
ncbi:putative gram domain protein [Phaeomoniella chlamydospora]|uniref:Putative gram domain protein n=1 Tax=Phaeomoniella chlamydospora TaxID=158046 RepID=A0A0G2E0D5_PHACM|nr:putative gram domain protein [Phaeomoniella chlamydospora]